MPRNGSIMSEAAVGRDLQAKVLELLVEAGLRADRRGFGLVAGPGVDRVGAAKAMSSERRT
jgi:hypothetical protein